MRFDVLEQEMARCRQDSCNGESCKTPKLQIGLSTLTGWKRVIDDFDQQQADSCSTHEAFNCQLKCRHVSLALRRALDDVPAKTWLDCCKAAVKGINRADCSNEKK